MKLAVMVSVVLAVFVLAAHPAYGMINDRPEEIEEPRNVFISIYGSINLTGDVSKGSVEVIGPLPPPVNWLEILQTIFSLAGGGTTFCLGIAALVKWLHWIRKHRKSTTPVAIKDTSMRIN